MSAWRKIAAASWRKPTQPTVLGVLEVDMTRALEFVHSRRAGGDKITVTSLVVRAVSHALSRHPEINQSFRFFRIRPRRTIDVFVQIAVEGGELSGTLIHEPDKLSVSEVAATLRRRALEIRQGKDPAFNANFRTARLTPGFLLRPLLALASFFSNDLRLHMPSLGINREPFGSAMVTSVGMLGIDFGFAPFFPLARCPIVLLVPSIQDRPWVIDGKVEVRPVMAISATLDHRIIDGVHGGTLARCIREYLEDPSRYEPGPAASNREAS